MALKNVAFRSRKKCTTCIFQQLLLYCRQ